MPHARLPDFRQWYSVKKNRWKVALFEPPVEVTRGIKKTEDHKCRRNTTWTKLLCNSSDAPWFRLC
ncbi:hypothetical protein PILCRDRAFT_813037 [Piloderma croceum F 1598]|uniref:Uncharacterized protein n=1 Tax=Piloderma croceum (strain F 1598) TaxID=765440 RepID=A0A0C3FY73_PILCF|nr:hypothetical protein PILCRDRAFT_813037 [Piloderma croceum F 1598]